LENLSFDYLIFLKKTWIILGLLLVIGEVFVGGFILLSFGISAFLISVLLYLQFEFHDIPLHLESWREVLIAYAVLIVVVSVASRKFLPSRANKEFSDDINEYDIK
jgi:membrane protein implicated in regulation of membrane protease activity